MYNFMSDYLEGAHPSILKRLTEVNETQSVGYGEDDYCLEAKKILMEKMGREDVDIHFVVGGTQANQLCIDTFIRSFEAVISPSSGHINVHETGAIEFTGHKILTCEGIEGKLQASDIEHICAIHQDCHMVKPKLVFISNSTEWGTIYTKEELQSLSDTCHKLGLYLYMDGARLGSALCSEYNDLQLYDIAKLCDAFYIGGTKNGALLGEAIVIVNDELKKDFRYSIKEHGAMLAKGRLLGIQFVELFKEDLYFELAAHANEMAMILKQGLKEAGLRLKYESYTNQLFVYVNQDLLLKLQTKYQFNIQEIIDENTTLIRFVTSWNTPLSAIEEFISDLKEWTANV